MTDEKQKIEAEEAEEEMRDLTDDELANVTGGAKPGKVKPWPQAD